MNSSNIIKIIAAVIIIGIIGLFASGKMQFGQSNISPVPQSNTSSVSQETQSPVTLAVGSTFPDFTLTEVGGKTITRDLLKGKLVIIWFTTSWCVPCQVGALDVSKLDDNLGGKAFEVLVVFVDPKETDSDLKLWRKRFARDDWMVAFDNELTQLAAKVNLRFLDSKFLLDKNGIIKNIDFAIADEKYLNIIRGVVKEN